VQHVAVSTPDRSRAQCGEAEQNNCAFHHSKISDSDCDKPPDAIDAGAAHGDSRLAIQGSSSQPLNNKSSRE
jgi:hypothetical protein